MNPQTAKNLYGKLKSIEGWLSLEGVMLLAFLDKIQRRAGVAGNIFEIGVHHGKSALLLAHCIDPSSEILGICDVFDNQDENISGSGSGSYQIFLRNFKRFFRNNNFLKVFARSSDQLSLLHTSKNCRLFHIDGGHTAEEVYGDLTLASKAINENGIVVLDDLFNHAFPSVQEGLATFLQAKPDELTPFVIGFNKTVFSRRQAYKMYVEGLEDRDLCNRYFSERKYSVKKVKFCGAQTIVFSAHPRWIKHPFRTRIITSLPFVRNRLSLWIKNYLLSLRS
jgi:hypothetical protein